MTPEQWDRIKPAFEEALRLAPAERSAFAARKFPGEPELQTYLLALLASHDMAGSFLAEPSTVPVPAGDRRVFVEGSLVGGRFRILRFLGRGGMGEVYEARDERLQLRVALKTIRPEFAGDPETIARFEREIRVAREVTHENLCRVYDMVESPESATYCFTMEFLEGETLQELLRRGQLTPREALPLIRQVAAALEALHKAGIVHRDLKPGNIMLVPGEWEERRALLTDFGLAKPVRGEGEGDPFETRHDLPAGAPYFMAPELFRGGRPSRASDIYAFGLVVDEMVTTARAFNARAPEDVRRLKLESAPVPPSARSQGIPANWSSAIMRCLSFDPSARPESVTEVVRQLEARRTPSVWRSRRSAAAGLAAAGLLGVMLALGPPPPPQEKALVVFDPEEAGQQKLHLGGAIAGELVDRLSRLQRLRVVRFYDTRARAQPGVVKERLHLDGDLETAGPRLRLRLRLTDDVERRILWSDSFEGETRNTFALQSQAAAAVYRQLDATLMRDAVAAAGVQYSGYRLLRPMWLAWQQFTAPAPNSAAYEHYARGRQLFEERTLPATLAAIESFRKAIELEPRMAVGHAALAEAHTNLIELRYAPQDELIKTVRASAQRALEADPTSPDAQMMMARADQLDWNWAAAEQRYREVMRAHPAHARVRRMYANMIMQFGRFEEGLRENRHALDLDPYDYPAWASYGLHLFFAGKPDEALAVLDQTISRKDFLFAHSIRSSIYAGRGMTESGERRRRDFELAMEDARYVAEQETKAGSGETPMADHLYSAIFAMLGRKAEARAHLERLSKGADRGGFTPVALAHALLGEDETAMQLLKKAFDRRERWLYHLRVHPFWRPLAGRQDFQDIVQAMHL